MATQAASNSTPPPVPTRVPMVDKTLVATVPWINWFTRLGRLYGFNQQVSVDGVNVPQEIGLNFVAPLTATDNPDNGTTDIGISLPATPTTQFGVATANATTTDYATAAIVFPTPFEAVPVVVTCPASFPRGTLEPFECYPTDITISGFTANFACAVPTGGGGATIDSQVTVNWIAIA